MSPEYPCPVCGFIVFDTPSGGYEICDVCDWEDDPVQLEYPCMRGGANGKSFAEAQIGILKKIPIEQRECCGYVRDPKWRPLREGEFKENTGPSGGREYFDAIPEDVKPYYWEADA